MRRRPGLAGLQAKKKDEEKFKDVGEKLEEQKIDHITKQLALFKDQLEIFAKNHKHEINKNPVFRRQFQEICLKVGVDPLASQKGFWAQLLGVGDFYYELAVQVIEVCLAAQARHGGLLSMGDLLSKVLQRRGAQSQPISEDDVQRAIQKVAVLGEGFKVLTVGSVRMVLSVPVEMNEDHIAILQAAQATAHISERECCAVLSFSPQRFSSAMQTLLDESIVWVDSQTSGGEPEYWFPTLLKHKTSIGELQSSFSKLLPV